MPFFDNEVKGRHFAFMNYHGSSFHKLTGYRILILIIVTLGYATWFSTLGPYGQLSDLGPGLPLEERGFYTGAQAVEALSQLDAQGRKLKLISLICDLPNMLLSALMFIALIGFGIRRLGLARPVWTSLFAIPLAFLAVDFAEDLLIALTMFSRSEILGTIAGGMTALKFMTYIPAALLALGLGLSGLIAWFAKGRPKH